MAVHHSYGEPFTKHQRTQKVRGSDHCGGLRIGHVGRERKYIFYTRWGKVDMSVRLQDG